MDKKEEDINELLTYVNTRYKEKYTNSPNWKKLTLAFIFVLVYFLKDFLPTEFVTTGFAVILLVTSIFLVLLFKDRDWEGIFINLMIFLASAIFLFGYFVDLLFSALVIAFLLYFIYLTIKRSKNFALAVIFTFFILIYSLSYYFPFAFKLLPFIKEASKHTSQVTSNAVSDALKTTTNNILSSFKKALMPITNPEEFQAMMEKEKLKKKELPSLGKYSGVVVNKIIPSNLPLQDYKSNVLLQAKLKFDRDFLTLLNSISESLNYDDFKTIKNNFTCFILDKESLEPSGFCKINDNSNSFSKTTRLSNLAFTNILTLKFSYEDYLSNSVLRIKNKNELFSIVVGRIKENGIKAVQMENPLKISLAFINFKNDKYYSFLLAYLDETNNFLNNDVINSLNKISKVKESYLCLLLPKENNPIEKVILDDEEINPVLERGNLKCYELVKDRNLFQGFLKHYLEIHYNDNLKYIGVDFYIITKYELLKSIDLPIEVDYPLLPMIYIEKKYSLNAQKIFDLINKTWQDLSSSKEFIISLYNDLKDLNCQECNQILTKNHDLDRFDDKKSIFSLVLLGYFYEKYKLSQIALCRRLNLNLSDCNEVNLKSRVENILKKIHKDILKNNKLEECNLISNERISFDTALILGLFNFYLSNKDGLISCKVLKESSENGREIIENIRSLYEKSVRYLIIKKSSN